MTIGLAELLVGCSQGLRESWPYLHRMESSCSMWKPAKCLQHSKDPIGASFLPIARCGPCTAPMATSPSGTYPPGKALGRWCFGRYSEYSPWQSWAYGCGELGGLKIVLSLLPCNVVSCELQCEC